MRITARLLFLVSFSLHGLALGAQTQSVPLGAGKLYRGTLNLGMREESRRFRIQIPDDAYSITMELDSQVRELDLAMYDPAGNRLVETLPFQSEKILQIDRFSRPWPLTPGLFDVEVFLGSDISGRKVDFATFGLSFQISNSTAAVPLAVGTSHRGRLEGPGSPFEVFELTFPGPPGIYRLDLFENWVDLDLYLLAGPVPDPRAAILSNKKAHGFETITFDTRETARNPMVRNNRLYAMVVAPYDKGPQDFRLVLGAGSDPPLELSRFPTLIPPVNPMERASLSTVEIFSGDGGGSGTIIHPLGYVLTNHHVVSASGERLGDFVELGITTDPEKTSLVAFRARIVDVDVDRDLAMLKIEKNLADIDLPQGYRFPFLEALRSDLPGLGEEVFALGYPAIGGLGSRASITVTRGLIAGFQAMPFGVILKTDATVSTGSSGGALLDRQYRLIGIPTEVLSRGSGRVSYVYPLSVLPSSWSRYFPNSR